MYRGGRYYVLKGEVGVKKTCQKLVERRSFHRGAGYVIQSSSFEWWLMTNGDVAAQYSLPPSVQDAASFPPPYSVGGGGGGGGGGGAACLTPAVDSPFRIDDATLGSYEGKTYSKLTVGLNEPDATVKTLREEVLMVLPDVSGSMGLPSGAGTTRAGTTRMGWPSGDGTTRAGTTRMEKSNEAMHYIIDNCEGQKVVIVPWSTSSCTAFNGIIDKNTKQRAHDIVDSLHPGGGTNMLGAIRFAGEEMRKIGPDVPIHLIMLTDGEPDSSLGLLETCREVFNGLDLSVTTIGLNVDCKREVLDLTTGIPTAIKYPNRRNFLFIGEATERLTVQLARLLAVQERETQAVRIKVSFPLGVTAEAVEGVWNRGLDNTFEQRGNVSTMSEIKALFRLSLPDSGLPTGSMILVEATDPQDNSLCLRQEIPLDGRLAETDYNVGVLIETINLKFLLNQHATSGEMYEELLARLTKFPNDTLDVWSQGELERLQDQVAQIIKNLGTKQEEYVLAAGCSNYKTTTTNYRTRSAQAASDLARGSSSGYSYKRHGGGGGCSSDSMDVGPGSMGHKPRPKFRSRVDGGGGGGSYQS
jgi:hypothetical protein